MYIYICIYIYNVYMHVTIYWCTTIKISECAVAAAARVQSISGCMCHMVAGLTLFPQAHICIEGTTP